MAYVKVGFTTGDIVTAANMNQVETQYDEASTDLTTHTGNTTTAHGAVSAATANKIIIRDVSGRAAVATPSAAGDIATKGYADLMVPLAGGSMTGPLNIGGAQNSVVADQLKVTSYDADSAFKVGNNGNNAIDVTVTDYDGNNVLKVDGFGKTVDISTLTVTSTTKVTNLNVERVDGIHFQVSGGVLQYDSGSGWVSVSVQPNTWETADLKQANATDDTFYTVCEISGQGLLTRISSVSGASNDQLVIKVTIDGTADTWDNANAIESRQFDHGSVGAEAYYFNSICNIKFDTSLKVEIKQVSGGAADLYGSVDYGLV